MAASDGTGLPGRPRVTDTAEAAPAADAARTTGAVIGMEAGEAGEAMLAAQTAAAPSGGPACALIADGVERALDPRNVRYLEVTWAIGTVISGSLLLLPTALVLLLLPLPAAWKLPTVTLDLLLLGLLVWCARRWPSRVHCASSYRVQAAGIEIRRGVWWRKEISVPRSRIQHTDVSQGPLQRRFGLAALKIYTAGTEHSEVALSGLDHALALRIRDHLIVGSEPDAV